MKVNHNTSNQEKREKRVRAKLFGTQERPRLSVFRSNKHLNVQAINDEKGVTVAAASDADLSDKVTKTLRAVEVAKVFAERAKKANITAVIFDRGGYKYHGRVKAVADTLRELGIQV